VTPPVRTALVIGGGVAGPVTALALRRAGIDTRVFEAYANEAQQMAGTLAIAPNGLAALRLVGAVRAVSAAGVPLGRTAIADGAGKVLAEFPGLPGLEPSIGLWRSDLHVALRDHAASEGLTIEADKRLVDVKESAGEVTAIFADGSMATADVLIGADGINSIVRRLIDPQAPGPEHVPLLNFAGRADMAAPAARGAMHFVFGERGFFGYWADHEGRTAWFANLPDSEPMTIADARAVPQETWSRRLAEAFGDDVPAGDLLRTTPADGLAPLGSLEIMPKVPRWHRGRMVLVGDAVHALSPSSGQGASLAAESAVELARCMSEAPDPARAFALYEARRRPRVEKVARRARRTNSSKALGPVGVRMMGLIMPLAVRTFLRPERTLGYEQRYRIDSDWAAA
jgi:2-polyprenyl-6-methoxyphenol hydroxylase-like FAD-dependent oxidoreductase